MKTLGQVLKLATEFLTQHQVARPRLAAESLLAHYLGVKRIDLYMAFDRPLIEEELAAFRAGLKRAQTKEPIEYILGRVEFYNCSINTNASALIPRPETEILLDLVCKRLSGVEKSALDLCTGSGCLAIGLKKAHPHLDVTGVDISQDALQLAKQNADENAVEITWRLGDLFEPVADKKFDVVLCNPPYISQEEFETLDASVKEFEPKIALVSGSSGYEFYERLSAQLATVLEPQGQAFFEIGTGQGEQIKALFTGKGFQKMEVLSDWAGHDRFFSLKM